MTRNKRRSQTNLKRYSMKLISGWSLHLINCTYRYIYSSFQLVYCSDHPCHCCKFPLHFPHALMTKTTLLGSRATLTPTHMSQVCENLKAESIFSGEWLADSTGLMACLVSCIFPHVAQKWVLSFVYWARAVSIGMSRGDQFGSCCNCCHVEKSCSVEEQVQNTHGMTKEFQPQLASSGNSGTSNPGGFMFSQIKFTIQGILPPVML